MRKRKVQGTRALLMAARGAEQRISMACRFKLRVRRSGIDRLGVFAAQDIPAGVKVIEYAGERISRRETRRRFLEDVNGRGGKRNYLFRLDPYWTLDGSSEGNGAELINHSCAPNMKARLLRRRIWLTTIRKIRRGEELAYDYKFTKKAAPVRCHCCSASCRGTINVR